MTSERLMHQSLSFARAETRTLGRDDKGVILAVSAPFLEVMIDLRNELLAASHSNDAQFSVK
jgi:hypothetical protein